MAHPLSSPEEFRRFLKAFLEWMGRAEDHQQRVYRALLLQVSLGVARCDEIEAYNRRAVVLYSWQMHLVRRFRKAGLAVADAPFPPLIAHDVSVHYDAVAGEDIVNAKLKCQVNGTPEPGLQLGPARPCEFPTGELGALPWAALIWGVVTVTSLVILWQIARTWTGSEVDEANRAMLEEVGLQDARRLEAVNQCALAQLNRLSDPTAEKMQEIWEGCRKVVGEVAPAREPPYGSKTATMVTGIAVTAGILGVVFLATRRRKAA